MLRKFCVNIIFQSPSKMIFLFFYIDIEKLLYFPAKCFLFFLKNTPGHFLMHNIAETILFQKSNKFFFRGKKREKLKTRMLNSVICVCFLKNFAPIREHFVVQISALNSLT